MSIRNNLKVTRSWELTFLTTIETRRSDQTKFINPYT